MSTIKVMTKVYKSNRGHTQTLLDEVEKLPDSQSVLGWRPNPTRAHIAWQLMHIGITEDMFASGRLAPGEPSKSSELWPRFRGGSTPDDDVPSMATIRNLLAETRERLLETLGRIDESKLYDVPPALKEKGWRIIDVLFILSWHEPHHQGQAHATLNAYKATHK